jgi:hypothetical protein
MIIVGASFFLFGGGFELMTRHHGSSAEPELARGRVEGRLEAVGAADRRSSSQYRLFRTFFNGTVFVDHAGRGRRAELKRW